MKKYDEEVPDGSPSVETRTNFCPRDQYLRDRGWAIASRPKLSEAVWEKLGRKVTQSRALIEEGY